MSTDNDNAVTGNTLQSQDLDLNADLPKVDELTALKARADLMGVKYHPSVGVDKLREKITAAMSSEGPVAQDNDDSEDGDVEVSSEVEAQAAPVVAAETLAERRSRKRREANRLVRIIVNCMNPAKKEWEGEIFTVGNSLVGSFTKYVPFNNEEGWHVPHIILEQLEQRQAQIFVTTKDSRGNSTRTGKLIKEFAITILPDLTPDELQELAQRQAMSKTTA